MIDWLTTPARSAPGITAGKNLDILLRVLRFRWYGIILKSIHYQNSSGNYLGALDWVSRCVENLLESAQSAKITSVQATSAAKISGEYDAILTDPPYYDAIPYSDLMDFFYVWLRRSIPRIV